jgi:endonuclease/exonuclease/phosphatase family metal-dependent hydrolase
MADRRRPDGTTIESAIDHVYTTQEIENNTVVTKIPTSPTDHVSIMVKVNTQRRQKPQHQKW